jgi:putative spermidine/putrescine transport system substrate-binding protein
MRLPILTGAAVLGLAAFASGPAIAADSLTVVSWGGAYTKSQIEAYHKPYAAKYGTKIQSEDYNGGLAEVRAQVETGKITWDVVDVEVSEAVRGCDEGLFEPIDTSSLLPAPSGTPAEDDFIPGSVVECAVATIVWSTVFAYDADVMTGAKPTTLKDFFDVKKFPGKRGLRKTPVVNMEWALIADGVARDDVYDVLSTREGQDRAFKKLDSIKDHVLWWEAGAQPPQMLADGEVVMTSAYNGRIFNAQATENKNFNIVWDNQLFAFDFYAIVKGTERKDEALRYLQFATATEQLANQASWISYGPTRKSSAGMVGKHAISGVDMKPHMPTDPANFKTALLNNSDFWADNQDELNERFNAWLAK